MHLPTVTALGGGHGLFASLTALRRVTDHLTAVVTVADDGGSSGRLRAEFNCLPPGDLRMALAALCGDDASGRLWADVLQSRFGGDGPLGGHAIGNLLIAGLWERLGDPVSGLDMVGKLLGARGRVLPMSRVPLEIVAEVIGLDPLQPDEFTEVRGQHKVAVTHGDVRTIRLEPTEPPATPESVAAIEESDWVVLGPGSWFTSVMPHLLVPELARAITRTSAKRILTLNLVSSSETQDYTAAQHLELLVEHAPEIRLDVVLADQQFVRDDRHLAAYAASLGAELVVADLAVRDGTARHDPLRLASIYAELMGV
ncbi:uridine diphosphate-N-acetylglucosamine-binding protein YvcK [Naumannella halotolerans]|uniref:Putative gluconeogenesis factor n=1 Tax=Naumannella halotolerans TaxID=993414 RepID=A0A4R7J7V7_9ACTN|nr:uridine diphosphate-N-acetylglucosamine-binding protein YvcK [Naumannella halotolerans]TDT32846.1 putative cofD-like protein [Naumannella halotolerans]